MPENLPRAVAILLWLLIGVIVFGYLLMAHDTLAAILFAVVYYAVPAIWQMRNASTPRA